MRGATTTGRRETRASVLSNRSFQNTLQYTEFYRELEGLNRIVLTSVREEDLSYGSYFSHFLIEGMKGYADRNHDGTCSAEEIFQYAQPIVGNLYGLRSQIFDAYPGELPLT